MKTKSEAVPLKVKVLLYRTVEPQMEAGDGLGMFRGMMWGLGFLGVAVGIGYVIARYLL